MPANDKRKQSLYFPDEMLNEIMREAIRLDRSLSWMVQRAWRLAAEEVRKFPSVDHRAGPPAPSPGQPALRSVRTEPERLPANEPGSASAPDPQPGSQVREFITGKFETNCR